mmetsp:Transcript_19118/g.49017  ORF Transcript_19118/g.49017 Transcript_19118/m.49017 type:complete len:283 (-) Transcript_19118:57-905(-)
MSGETKTTSGRLMSSTSFAAEDEEASRLHRSSACWRPVAERGWSVVFAISSRRLWACARFQTLSPCLRRKTVLRRLTASRSQTWKDTVAGLCRFGPVVKLRGTSRSTWPTSMSSLSLSERRPRLPLLCSISSTRTTTPSCSASGKPSALAENHEGDELQFLAGHCTAFPTATPSARSAQARTCTQPLMWRAHRRNSRHSPELSLCRPQTGSCRELDCDTRLLRLFCFATPSGTTRLLAPQPAPLPIRHKCRRRWCWRKRQQRRLGSRVRCPQRPGLRDRTAL